MNSLLTTDTHFTDNPLDEYRWHVFEVLGKLIKEHQVKTLYVLGDLTDRKDRHSSNLVNRLLAEFISFLETPPLKDVYILMGNHDQPLKGVPFWEFLGFVNVHYITEPYFDGERRIALLPFAANPAVAWHNCYQSFGNYKALMMHQTVEGSIAEGDRVLKNPHPMPALPKHVEIFSGDVHRPQKVNNITYVGAPYPVRFSETWNNRVLLINNDDFKNPVEIPVSIIKRAILDISSVSELKRILPRDFKKDDQVKIRYQLTAQKMHEWPDEQDAIRKAVQGVGAHLVSLEAVLNDAIQPMNPELQAGFETMDPEEVLREFSKDAKLSAEVIEVGLELLKEGHNVK